jgi:hypothetical protein
MMHNIFQTASTALKNQLHKKLQTAIKCKGVVECRAILSGGG